MAGSSYWSPKLKNRTKFTRTNSTDLIRDATIDRIRETAKEKLKAEVLDQLNTSITDIVDEVIQGIDDVYETGAQNGDVTKKPRRERGELPDKEFVSRNSVLTELFEVDHIRTIQHIFVAVLIVMTLQSVVNDYMDNISIIPEFHLITWAFGQFPTVISLWLMMFGSVILIVYPVFHHWATTRPTGRCNWYDFIYLSMFFTYQLCLFCLPLKVIYQQNLPPASTVLIACEQVRLVMKVHAFVRSNIPRAIKYKPHSDDEDEQGPCPDFSKYLYFLFAPTIVYRDNYPRTPSIRWHYVFTNFLQVFACICYVYYIFARFCVPQFQHFDTTSLTPQSLVLSCFGSMLPGTLVLFVGFFAILHSWMNAFAEMLQFGDRLFYKDWWNSSSFATYYRTWNVVVHDWLYTYVYREACLFLPQKSRPAAMAIVFTISALVHEYILTVSFRFFYPVLFFMFGGAGFAFVFVNNSSYKRSGNIFMWLSLFMGTGILMCLYSMEWFARKNCPATMDNFLDYVIPRSWTCDIYLDVNSPLTSSNVSVTS